MSTLLSYTAELPLAALFGTAGLAAQMIWPLFKSRRKILTVQLGATCAYATSYALMGQETATAICLTGAIQTTIAILAGDTWWLKKMGYAFLPLVLLIGAATYAGIHTLFAVTACCLVMIGRLQSETLRMRRIQLMASPFGATHDLLIGAWPCLAGALVTFTIALAAYARELRDQRQAPQVA